jgi:hypothetical protein
MSRYSFCSRPFSDEVQVEIALEVLEPDRQDRPLAALALDLY